MRKGHDFHKDKDVGEFVKLWLMRENTHVSSSLVLLPTNFIKNICWQLGEVMVVIVFGSGVAGMSVLAYAHTPPMDRLFSPRLR